MTLRRLRYAQSLRVQSHGVMNSLHNAKMRLLTSLRGEKKSIISDYNGNPPLSMDKIRIAARPSMYPWFPIHCIPCSDPLTEVLHIGILTMTTRSFYVRRVKIMADGSFDRLNDEKKKRVIHGAIGEFAEYGFDGASTNRIVKKAGIAKGSLFNYFSSKEDLYLYAAEYVLKDVVPLIRSRMEGMPADILERLRLMTAGVIDVYIDNPLYYRFFMGILDPGAVHLQRQLLEKNAELFGFLDFFRGADTSRFRRSEESIFLLIKWLFTGIKQELFEVREVQEDPAVLRRAFLERLENVLEVLEHGIYT